MGKGPGDERDYDEFKVKVPRHDKSGKDITGDKVGPGGRRREDGTLSAMAYDFEDLPEEESIEDLEERLRLYADAEERDRIIQRERTQDGIDNIFYLLDTLMCFLEDHPEVVVKIVDGARALGSKAADGFRALKKGAADLKGKLTPKALKERHTGIAIKATVKKAPLDDSPQVLEIEESEAPQPIILSQEEAAREVFKALNHYIELKKSLEKLSNANVVDLKALGFKGVIASLESCIQQYPALMDAGNQQTILEMLRTDFDEPEKIRIREVLGIGPANEAQEGDTL